MYDKIKNIIAAALALYSTKGEAAPKQEKPIKLETIAKKEAKSQVSGSFEYMVVTKYVARPGFIVDDESQQTTAKLHFGNFTFFDWENVGKKGSSEIDRGIVYGIPFKDFLNGILSASISCQKWYFSQVDKADNVLEWGLNYNGKINAKATLSQIIGGSDAEKGSMVHATISKPLNLDEKGDLTLTPLVQTAYLDNFYGATGFSHVTIGAEFALKLTSDITLKAYLKHQDGKNGFEDKTYAGVGAEIKH